MIRSHVPLNSLRAFEAAGRHLSFTSAAIELRVTPAALSHQVKSLEDRLGVSLFRRLPRGLALTDEGKALLPVLSDCLDRVATALERMTGENPGEVISIGVVGTFAVSWLLGRLDDFRNANPDIDLRISTNNNRVDLAEEGLDLAIRFGDGAWHSTDADLLFAPPFTPLCSPAVASRIKEPADLLRETLLRSYRLADWRDWLAAAGVNVPAIRGPIFDSAALMIDAATRGFGIALGPASLFKEDIEAGRLFRPFSIEVELGAYWLTRLKSRAMTPGMRAFSDWLLEITAQSREPAS